MIISPDKEPDVLSRLYENGQITLTVPGKKPFTPDHKDKVRINGSMAKKYYISPARYRKICSSAINLFRKRKFKVIFITLTFPGKIDHKDANRCFSKYIDNLSTNYNLNAYVAVHEFTHKGNSHYHLLCDLPYVPIFRLNNAWNFAISDFVRGSPNSVRLPTGKNKGVVKNFERCVRYCCKYFAKGRKYFDGELRLYDARCSFISYNVLSRPLDIDREIFEKISEKFQVEVAEYDWCRIFQVKDILHRYDEFCEIMNKFVIKF